jgi:hypothetical protein
MFMLLARVSGKYRWLYDEIDTDKAVYAELQALRDAVHHLSPGKHIL